MRMVFWERVFVNSFLWDWYLRRRLRVFLGHAPAAPARILEVGCGKGTTTRALAEAFPCASILAVDIDPAQVALAWKRLPGRLVGQVTFRATDVNRVPGAYDAVTEFHTLHHVEEWRGLLHSMLKRVRPGGLFMCVDVAYSPLLAALWKALPKAVRPYFPCGPSFSKLAVMDELRRAGFTVERDEGKGHFALVARKAVVK